ncbi:MAG TPA: hypothetical protein VKU77_33760 [Streptosporangiaceae bacterium]|nr:hypothetical protein [Streptosporangiaceae bacterium]
MNHTTRPSSPGAIIGYRRNGCPIRLIAGGSGEDSEGTGTAGQEDGAGSAGTGQQDTGTGPEGAGSGEGAARDERGRFAGGERGADDDAGRTERTIAAIRADFKDERARRQAAEKRLTEIQSALDADKAERQRQMDALAVALGLKSGDQPPDPEKLAAELQAARDSAAADLAERDKAIRQSRAELAVLRAAGKHGANGDALLDSRSFMAKVSGLDPDGGDFGEQLAEAIRAAVEAGPQYRAAAQPAAGQEPPGGAERKPTAPSRSGGEHKAPGGNRQWTLADVEAATPSEVVAAQDQGLLADLGYPPRRKTR